MIQNHKSYLYAKKCMKSTDAPKYVKKQCRIFCKIADGKDKKYIIDEKKVQQIDNLLRLLIMPKGLRAGQTLYEATTNYQWLFYISVLCTVYRDNPKKRRYDLAKVGRYKFNKKLALANRIEGLILAEDVIDPIPT